MSPWLSILFVLFFINVVSASNDLEISGILGNVSADSSQCSGETCFNIVSNSTFNCYVNYSTAGWINYAELVYCRNKGQEWVGYVAICGILACLFIWSGLVSSSYSSPNIVALARLINLPDQVAGVTLIGFGNALPDILTSFISIAEVDNFSLAFGTLLGSALFGSCIIVGTVCIVSKSFSVPKIMVRRDLLFCLVATVVLGIFAWDESFAWYEGMTLVLLYVAYVVIVLVGNHFHVGEEYLEKTCINSDNMSCSSKNSSKQELRSKKILNYYSKTLKKSVRISSLEQALLCSSALCNEDRDEHDINSVIELGQYSFGKFEQLHDKFSPDKSYSTITTVQTEKATNNFQCVETCGTCALLMVDAQEHTSFYKFWKYHFLPIASMWKLYGPAGKVLAAFNFIPTLVLQSTVPVVASGNGVTACDNSQTSTWSHRYIVCMQLLLGPVVLSSFLLGPQFNVASLFNREASFYLPAVAVFGALGLLASICVFFSTLDGRKPKLYQLVALPGFLLALAWSYLIISEVVSILNFFSTAFGIPASLTGASIYVVGANIGDVVSAINTCRMGLPVLATSSSLGNQVISLTLNGGLVMLFKGFSAPLISQRTGIVTICFLALLAVYAAQIILLTLRNRHTTLHGIFFVMTYILAIALMLLVTLI